MQFWARVSEEEINTGMCLEEGTGMVGQLRHVRPEVNEGPFSFDQTGTALQAWMEQGLGYRPRSFSWHFLSLDKVTC